MGNSSSFGPSHTPQVWSPNTPGYGPSAKASGGNAPTYKEKQAAKTKTVRAATGVSAAAERQRIIGAAVAARGPGRRVYSGNGNATSAARNKGQQGAAMRSAPNPAADARFKDVVAGRQTKQPQQTIGRLIAPGEPRYVEQQTKMKLAAKNKPTGTGRGAYGPGNENFLGTSNQPTSGPGSEAYTKTAMLRGGYSAADVSAAQRPKAGPGSDAYAKSAMTPAAKGVRAAKGMKPGQGGRFAKLKADLADKPGVTDPGALAASIGRKKFGPEKFAAMGAKGRKRGS